MGERDILRLLSVVVPGVIRVANNIFFAVGRDTKDVTCTAEREGAQRWRRGGSGSASTLETCLKTSSDTYAWTTSASGGSPGLAAHILDTTTHGTTGDIVGTSDAQTLTNKTLTSPTITTPNGLVKGDVGLGNVDNTSDATKNSAVATLTNKTLTSPVINSPTISSPSGLVKGDVGLGNVDNTSDATKNAAAVTLTNKTLTTPTIGDFSNATHAHTNAASGGTLSASAIASGTIGTARLGAGVADSSVFLRGDQTWSELPLVPWVWNAFYVGQFGTQGSGNGEFADGIRGIAVRPDTGDVYVSSGTGASSKVQKFSANGTYDSTIAMYGTGDGQVDTPWGMSFHPRAAFTSEMLVVDSGNLRLLRFGDDIYFAEEPPPSPLVAPKGATHNQRGRSFGTDNHKLYAASANEEIGSFGSGPGEFDTPIGIYAYQRFPSTQRVIVADSGNHRTQVLDWDWSANTAEMKFSFGSFGSSKGQFNTPDSIAIDAHGNIYVTDSGNHRVQVFDSTGVFQGSFGSFGTGDGEFNTPTGIAITDDYIYVCDSGNHRVQIFANPAVPVLGEVQILTQQATAGVANSSTVTYATVAEIDTYGDGSDLILPKGTWDYIATFTQGFTATTVATYGAVARFNGTDGASATFSCAGLNADRAVMAGSTNGQIESDGASITTFRVEYVRSASFAATPTTERGHLTVILKKVA